MLHPDFNELSLLRFKAGNLVPKTRIKTSSSFAGSYSSSFRGQGMEFEEVRQYVAGDDVRNIHWGATARTGRPHVKIFREERERSIIIAVDRSAHMNFGTRGTFKSIQAARAAALIGWAANKEHDRVGAILFGEENISYFPPSRTRKSLWNMIKRLCNSGAEMTHSNSSLDEAVNTITKHAHSGSMVFIIADLTNISENFENKIANLSNKCEVVILPVSDPADYDIAAVGEIGFSDKGEKIIIDTDDEDGRELYKQQYLNSRLKLERICSSLGIHIVDISTNKDVYISLLEGFRCK